MQSDKVQRGRHGLSCLSDKPSLSGPPLLAARKAFELAAVFETLPNARCEFVEILSSDIPTCS
jgi:hypothetical protein